MYTYTDTDTHTDTYTYTYTYTHTHKQRKSMMIVAMLLSCVGSDNTSVSGQMARLCGMYIFEVNFSFARVERNP